MKDSRYYFTLGMLTMLLISMVLISCTEPLGANYCEPGSAEYCPLYVKVVE